MTVEEYWQVVRGLGLKPSESDYDGNDWWSPDGRRHYVADPALMSVVERRDTIEELQRLLVRSADTSRPAPA